MISKTAIFDGTFMPFLEDVQLEHVRTCQGKTCMSLCRWSQKNNCEKTTENERIIAYQLIQKAGFGQTHKSGMSQENYS